MATTKTYVVKHPKISYAKADADGKLIKKPKDYLQGSTIELDDDEAVQLLEVGAIEEAPSDSKKK